MEGSLCLFCNEEVGKRPYNVLAELEFGRDWGPSYEQGIFATALEGTCVACNNPLTDVFDKIKLPGCDHAFHKHCFENHWVHELTAKYSQDNVAVFEEMGLGLSCPLCAAEVSLEYILYAVPWSELVAKICEKLQAEHKSASEQLSRVRKDAEVTCCRTKVDLADMRALTYDSLISTSVCGSFISHCKLQPPLQEVHQGTRLSRQEVPRPPRTQNHRTAGVLQLSQREAVLREHCLRTLCVPDVLQLQFRQSTVLLLLRQAENQ